MAVIAQSNDGTDRWLRSVLSGRPLDGSVMQTAASFGAITLRDGSAKAKVQLLPFDGDEYGVFAFVDAALLLNEAHGSERLSLTQRLMITPMVRTAAGQLVAATETSLAQYEAESANEPLEAVQRSAATKKAVHQTDIRDALNLHTQPHHPVTRGVHHGGFPADAELPVPWRVGCSGPAYRAQWQ